MKINWRKNGIVAWGWLVSVGALFQSFAIWNAASSDFWSAFEYMGGPFIFIALPALFLSALFTAHRPRAYLVLILALCVLLLVNIYVDGIRTAYGGSPLEYIIGLLFKRLDIWFSIVVTYVLARVHLQYLAKSKSEVVESF